MTRFRNLTFLLALFCAWPALAGNPLPRPRIIGPAQVNNRAPLTLRFTFAPVSWDYQSFWHLFSWSQYWHCVPGKDSPPTEISLQSQPWPGQTNPCTRQDNRYSGIEPHSTQDIIQVPREGGIPATGTWYVRVRLAWVTSKSKLKPENGPWSAWHRVTVVQSFNDVAKAPRVLAPSNGQVFANRNIAVRVMAMLRHPNPARWTYAFEWQRATWYTKANNDYVNPHPKPTDFPRVLGLASPYRAWSAPASLRTLDEAATPSTLQVPFSQVHANRFDASYVYRFRVREALRAGNAHGPWSDWHSFVVTDPMRLRVMRPMQPVRRLKTH